MASREKIVDAAAAEFAERGLHGVRLEHVAKRSGFNKALLYRYFGDKDSLFEEAVRRETDRRLAFVAELPEDPAAVLGLWSDRQAADSDYIKLIAEEGLRHSDGAPIVAADERRAYYAAQIVMLRAWADKGKIPERFANEAGFFALLLLTVGPVILPQIASLVMGEGYEETWSEFLTEFAELLGDATKS